MLPAEGDWLVLPRRANHPAGFAPTPGAMSLRDAHIGRADKLISPAVSRLKDFRGAGPKFFSFVFPEFVDTISILPR
jgi:hypothetical protein